MTNDETIIQLQLQLKSKRINTCVQYKATTYLVIYNEFALLLMNTNHVYQQIVTRFGFTSMQGSCLELTKPTNKYIYYDVFVYCYFMYIIIELHLRRFN